MAPGRDAIQRCDECRIERTVGQAGCEMIRTFAANVVSARCVALVPSLHECGRARKSVA